MLTEKTCKGVCGKTLSVDEFHWKCKRKGTRQARCKDCMSIYGKSHYLNNSQEYKDRANGRLKALRATNRQTVKSFLMANPCSRCAETNYKVLEISVTSTEVNNLSTEALTAKLAPTGVLCRNCQASQD